LVIDVVWCGAASAGGLQFTVALFQDATANALAAIGHAPPAANYAQALHLTHMMTSGTTSSTTFRVRVGGNVANTTTFNGAGGGRTYGGVMASSIVITETL
jgi:hypothetical protein